MPTTALARYFKQIVKSARANGTAGPTEDHTDDFLGCLNIPVRVSRCGVGLVTLREGPGGCPSLQGAGHCLEELLLLGLR